MSLLLLELVCQDFHLGLEVTHFFEYVGLIDVFIHLGSVGGYGAYIFLQFGY